MSRSASYIQEELNHACNRLQDLEDEMNDLEESMEYEHALIERLEMELEDAGATGGSVGKNKGIY